MREKIRWNFRSAVFTRVEMLAIVGFCLLICLLACLPHSADALDDPDTVICTFSGEGQFWTYDAVEAGQTATKTQLSGTGAVEITKVTEWNETGSVQQVSGSMIYDDPGDWSNRYIGGASEDKTGVHRLEMRSLGNFTVSSMLSVDADTLSSSHTFETDAAYFENVVETPVANKTHLADRSRTYFEGSNASGTFEFVAIVPPGAEGDWLACMSCVDEFDDQPDWESEDIFGYSSGNGTCDDGSCEVEEDEVIVIS